MSNALLNSSEFVRVKMKSVDTGKIAPCKYLIFDLLIDAKDDTPVELSANQFFFGTVGDPNPKIEEKYVCPCILYSSGKLDFGYDHYANLEAGLVRMGRIDIFEPNKTIKTGTTITYYDNDDASDEHKTQYKYEICSVFIMGLSPHASNNRLLEHKL